MTTIAAIILGGIFVMGFWGFWMSECGVIEHARDGEGCDGVGKPIGEEEWL